VLNERCAGCPRREAGLPDCIGENLPAYCAIAKTGHPGFITRILAWQPMDAEGETQSAEPPASAARPVVAESLATLDRMKACPHRTSETSCGCGGMARCALGKGHDGLVNHADCFGCLQSPAARG